jgi:hypothetical protein
VRRWQAGAAVNAPDMSTFYPGPKGYTDYPTLTHSRISGVKVIGLIGG